MNPIVPNKLRLMAVAFGERRNNREPPFPRHKNGGTSRQDGQQRRFMQKRQCRQEKRRPRNGLRARPRRKPESRRMNPRYLKQSPPTV